MRAHEVVPSERHFLPRGESDDVEAQLRSRQLPLHRHQLLEPVLRLRGHVQSAGSQLLQFFIKVRKGFLHSFCFFNYNVSICP